MNLPANLEKILFQTVKMMKTDNGHCRTMETEIASFCCRDTNEAADNYFEGQKCITESEGFKMVCLSRPVLDTALTVFNHFRGDSIENVDNKSYRFARYKQYIF